MIERIGIAVTLVSIGVIVIQYLRDIEEVILSIKKDR